MDKPNNMKPCECCASSGFSDRVHRGAFTMSPKDKICKECKGRGWVDG